MRRILVVPAVGRYSVADDVGYQELYALTKTLSESGEKAFWYVLMPTWVRDGLQGHDRMHYIYLDCTRDPTVNDVVGYPAFELAQYFARRGGRLIIDAVITGCSRFSLYMRQLLSDRVRGNPVPVFIREYARVLTWDTPFEWTMLAANYVGCHLGVKSEAELKSVSQFVRKHLAPAMQKTFLANAVVWPQLHQPIECERVKDVTAFCGGDFARPGTTKKVLEIYRKLFVTCNVPTVLATSVPQYKVDNALPRGDSSFLRVMETGLPLAVCRDQIARTHFFISAGMDDSDLGTFQEEIGRLLLGQVGVFPATEWTLARLSEDYPFLYNPGKVDEAYLMAEWIVENYDQAARMISAYVEPLLEESSPGNSAMAIWGKVKAEIDAVYKVNRLDIDGAMGQARQPLFNTMFKIAEGLGEYFSLDVFLDILEEHVTWLKPWSRKGTLKELGVSPSLPTLYDLREMLDNLGWVDTCEGMNIMVRNERDSLPGVFNEG